MLVKEQTMGLFDNWGQKPARGKVSNMLNAWGIGRILKRHPEKSVDYTRNDYKLFKAIYYGSKFNSIGGDYLLAAPFGKNIVNALASFTIGSLFEVGIPDNQAAQDDINEWVEKNGSLLFDFGKLGFRDGDVYVYVDELGEASLLDPDTVDVMLDPMTGDVIGYDVTEEITLVDPTTNKKTDYTYLKQYRTDSMQILRWPTDDATTEGQIPDTAETIYKAVYHEEGDSVEKDGIVIQQGNDQSALSERPLPIVHFANDVEPRSVYGNSEFQNLLILFLNYHQVLNQAIISNMFNNDPILVIKGIKNKKAFESESQAALDKDPDWDKREDEGLPADNTGGMSISHGQVLYTTGDGDAKYVTSTGVMADTSALLGVLFNLIVQGSETPEFIFGAAVASSKASTESQMPGFVKKAERKRQQINDALLALIELYIYRQQQLSNPLYFSVTDETNIAIKWPPILNSDKTLDLNIVKQLQATTSITDATAVKLLLGDRVPDADAEVAAAKKENENNSATQVPTQSDRLLATLLANKEPVNPTDENPDEPDLIEEDEE
jgi:hypothetical protein